jgi:uncharacterized protein YciI
MPEYKQYFVDFRTSVPDMDKVRAIHADAHHKYLVGLKDQGKIFMAGRLADGSGGLVIFSTTTLEEAQALTDKDPLVASGVQKSNVKQWSTRIY